MSNSAEIADFFDSTGMKRVELAQYLGVTAPRVSHFTATGEIPAKFYVALLLLAFSRGLTFKADWFSPLHVPADIEALTPRRRGGENALARLVKTLGVDHG